MAKNKNNAKMVDISLYIQSGFDPKTGLPMKFDSASDTKTGIKMLLRLIDEQDAVNRYKWYNIPFKLSSNEIERLLYYRGQLAAFLMDETQEFYLMPYALNSTIDVYGRYNTVKPVPFGSGEAGDGESKKRQDALIDMLSEKRLSVKYEPILPEDLEPDDITSSAILLHDYTKQIPQSIIPRQQVNDVIIDVMADIFCFLRTSLSLATGVKGVRVQDSDQAADVMTSAKQVLDYARKNIPWVALTGAIDFQEIADGPTGKTEDFLLALQALDNVRLQTLGLPNGGIFEKKAHILESENAMNQQAIDRVYQDGLSIRQHFCNIFNSIYGTSLWCMPSESVMDADLNGDGIAADQELNDNIGGGAETAGEGGAE